MLFADESEALTRPYLARAWAKCGADLRVPAPGQAVKVAMVGSWDWTQRTLILHSSRTKRSADFIAHLEQLDQLYGPGPVRRRQSPWSSCSTNGPIRTSKVNLAALKERSHWLTVEWLPKYAPELNDIEIVWGQMKTCELAHQTFSNADELDQAIHAAVNAMNQRPNRPNRHPLVNRRIPA